MKINHLNNQILKPSVTGKTRETENLPNVKDTVEGP